MKELIIQFGGQLLLAAGGAYAVLRFLGKTLVQHELSKSLKDYDAQLAEKTESLKTQLSIYAHEQNVALARIDAQRANAIQAIYASSRKWVNYAAKIAVGCPYVNMSAEADLSYYMKNAESAHESAKQLLQILADHAIYFDIDTYSELAELTNDSADATASFLSVLREGAADGAPPDELLSHVERKRGEFKARYENEIQRQLIGMTENFRRQLGVIQKTFS